MLHSDDELLNLEGTPSVCYGCGAVLRNLSMLICAECLHQECDEFVKAASSSPKKKNHKKSKK